MGFAGDVTRNKMRKQTNRIATNKTKTTKSATSTAAAQPTNFINHSFIRSFVPSPYFSLSFLSILRSVGRCQFVQSLIRAQIADQIGCSSRRKSLFFLCCGRHFPLKALSKSASCCWFSSFLCLQLSFQNLLILNNSMAFNLG
ncbi:hypothetical protein niasHT_000126 [Heterodera trifolii]|uniref:Uncharacterized protein n=1 Tax=Heterodera trifolii TaxID=157864 RepID=A0ABD2M2Z4_9BILA